ncbi:hypothetical protein GHNINEIG_00009 [Hydrogenovibrio crunogenus]|uniref:DUF3240 domain-containing protein n=1 Tax=Hydrogenovibrio crunogenus TaxID=39765 RepID=A0A4P7NWZ5_9GAMM|nr:DUF3240 family protein [Hydrogenovibrio crunogenus]QBZ81985.1 hypothetical protein GHNINEIG_00009 [Hydrogenovibrio crunogenus]RUM92539.1 MAG: hypothetical protein DSZ27_03260 [Thiomicrospira sp.]
MSATSESSAAVTLQLLVDCKLQHDLTDQLLVLNPAVSFQLHEVKSYHQQQSLETTSEKVSGYQPKIILNIQTTETFYPEILAHLKKAVPHTRLYYQVFPCLAQGIY